MNQAQKVLVKMGVDKEILSMPKQGRLKSHTKKGPGRIHRQGKTVDTQ